MNVVKVVTEAVEKEGRKWRALSDDMEPIKTAAERLDLKATAFFIGLSVDVDASIHSATYNKFQSFMVGRLGEAVTEFDQLGAALAKIAKKYDETDSISALNLNDIYSA